MAALVADLRQTVETSVRRWSGRARKHVARGKLCRGSGCATCLDVGSPFLELSQLAAWDMYDNQVRLRHPHRHRAGQRARVHDRGERRDVKGGTYFPSRSRSICAPEIAQQNACPAFTWSIPVGRTCQPGDVFPDREHFGRIFFNQANMSALASPDCRVMGSCTGRATCGDVRRVDHRQEPGHHLPGRSAAGAPRPSARS